MNNVGNKKIEMSLFLYPMIPPKSSTCGSTLLGVSRGSRKRTQKAEGPISFRTSFCQKLGRQSGVKE